MYVLAFVCMCVCPSVCLSLYVFVVAAYIVYRDLKPENILLDNEGAVCVRVCARAFRVCVEMLSIKPSSSLPHPVLQATSV